MQLDKITSEVVSKYRDGRLREVSNNTVRLELAFISVVFEQCAKEWGYKVINPVKQIRIPKPGKPRQRRLRPGEEEALLAACAASSATYLHSLVVLAIETGMRFGELVSITWDNVDFAVAPFPPTRHEERSPQNCAVVDAGTWGSRCAAHTLRSLIHNNHFTRVTCNSLPWRTASD